MPRQIPCQSVSWKTNACLGVQMYDKLAGSTTVQPGPDQPPLQTQAQAHVLQLHGSGMRAWDWGPGGEERPCTWGDMASHGYTVEAGVDCRLRTARRNSVEIKKIGDAVHGDRYGKDEGGRAGEIGGGRGGIIKIRKDEAHDKTRQDETRRGHGQARKSIRLTETTRQT